MPVGHALDVHEFLVIRAVVVHHHEQWDVMMRRGPQYAGGVHQIAVAIDAHRQPPVFLVRQRGADRRRRAVAYARAARAADVLVVLGEIPQAHRPAAEKSYLGD